mgnify:CR=1 FL=1
MLKKVDAICDSQKAQFDMITTPSFKFLSRNLVEPRIFFSDMTDYASPPIGLTMQYAFSTAATSLIPYKKLRRVQSSNFIIL